MKATLWLATILVLGGICVSGHVLGQNIEVRIDNTTVRFIGPGPQEYRGRVLVPLRGVLEQLGAYVGWDDATRTVFASRGDMSIKLPIGSDFGEVNGRRVALDVPAMTVQGTTMVPLRFVGEALGATVRWDAAQRTVLIERTPNERDDPTRDSEELRRRRENRVVREPEPVPIPTPVVKAPVLTITSLSHDMGNDWIRPGQRIAVTLRGTSESQAFFRIPGIVQETPMREVSSGVYRAVWTVPTDRPLQIADASIIGVIRAAGRESPLIQAGDPLRFDAVPPRIEDPLPADGSVVSRRRPLISSAFDDQNGSGIDKEKVMLLLDRIDVTKDAVITDRHITYTPGQPLEPGDRNVKLTVWDQAGNSSSKSWSFNIPRRQRTIGIRTIQANTDRVLEPGDVLTLRMEGTPASRATFTVGSIRNVPLLEQPQGVYNASYTIRKGDDVASAPLVVTLITPEGDRFTDTTERAVQITTGPPAPPLINYPAKDQALTNPLIVRGSATPYSTVRLKLEYLDRLLGALGVRGTADEQELKVGADGKWISRPIDMSSLLGSRRTEYTLTATAVSPNKERSSATVLRFMGRF